MRKQLSKTDIKELLSKYGYLEKLITKKTNVVQDNEFLLIENKPLFLFKNDVLIPTLMILLKDISLLPKVVVDKGAIKFVANGADIMRPGIVSFEEFKKDDFVVIVEETYNKPLAVGQALFSSEEIKSGESGKVIKNIHYVGDEIWEKSK
ncbi:MAG: PUA domain-containing protein [Candidatus Woesearchaeota archaeon]